jgi:hypothetical protein
VGDGIEESRHCSSEKGNKTQTLYLRRYEKEQPNPFSAIASGIQQCPRRSTNGAFEQTSLLGHDDGPTFGEAFCLHLQSKFEEVCGSLCLLQTIPRIPSARNERLNDARNCVEHYKFSNQPNNQPSN